MAGPKASNPKPAKFKRPSVPRPGPSFEGSGQSKGTSMGNTPDVNKKGK